MALAAWEAKVRDRVRRGIKKYGKTFADAKAQKKSEADISGLVFVMLEDVFGYDKVSEVTAEYRVRASFADYAVKLGGKPVFLIEMKAPTVRLSQNHLFQVSGYAMQLGVEWVVLTNGLVWQLFHISKATPVEEEAVFECDLTEGPKPDTVEKLCVLAREYVMRGEPRKTYERVQAVRPKNLLRALYTESVLSEMRRVLRRDTGYKPEIDELRDLVDKHLLRHEIVRTVRPKRAPQKRARASAGRAPRQESQGAPLAAPALSQAEPEIAGPDSS